MSAPSAIVPSTYLHVFVIGAASSLPSPGQLPSPANLSAFLANHPDKYCHFYFIDPQHYEVKADLEIFALYQQEDLAFSVVPRIFQFSSFYQEYRIDPGNECLFIDYAGVTTSEYDFLSNLGDKPGWFYWSPGCAGSRLDLEEAWNIARNVPRYTLYSRGKVPAQLSPAYRYSLALELNQVCIYARLLPSSEHDPPAPEWLRERDQAVYQATPEILGMMKTSAFHVLSQFFLNNDSDISGLEDRQWYAEGKKLLGI